MHKIQHVLGHPSGTCRSIRGFEAVGGGRLAYQESLGGTLRAPIITGRCFLSPETCFLSQETYCLHVSCHKKHVPRETTPVSCDRKPTSCHKRRFSSRDPRSSSLELRPCLVTRNAPLGPGSRGCKKRAFWPRVNLKRLQETSVLVATKLIRGT